MKIWRKNSVKWTLNGKRVSPNTEGSIKKTVPSKRHYGTIKTYDGKRKQTPLTEGTETSRQLLRRLQAEEDRRRALGIDRCTVNRTRPLTELLAEYERFLLSKNNTERYVSLTMRRVRVLVDAIKAKTIDDLEASRISTSLSAWRQRKKNPVSIGTTNHYSRAIKGFSRWLWTERITIDDPLMSLRLLNASTDRRHNRRALTPDELKRLIQATQASRKRLRGLTAEDRALLYLVALYTGLRASELASLTKSSFDLEAKTVTVKAAYSKRRRSDTLPLHASLVERLRPWLLKKDGQLWRGTWASHRCANCTKMLRSDLKRAEIDYVDEQGRYADFHALRHTFVSQLARSGVHPLKAKELARHSTIALTMDVYSHVTTDELREALDTLPPIT